MFNLYVLMFQIGVSTTKGRERRMGALFIAMV